MLQKRILIIENSDEITKLIKELFNDSSLYVVISTKVDREAIKSAMDDIPDIILINDDDHVRIYKDIVGNNIGFMTPVIGFSSRPYKEDLLKSVAAGIDYYMVKPLDRKYIYYVIQNMMRLLYNNRTVSPLTGLPGNIQITNELRRRTIRRDGFVVLYVDLDNFKAYNDTYGFLKGDEVIKLTADIIVSAIKEYGTLGDFVGHIGGDDFVAITTEDQADNVCKSIVKNFDEKILSLLNDRDIERGVFEVPNRKGIIEQYPLTSISVAGVVIRQNEKIDVLEIGEIGAQIKHKVKTMPGSSYYISKRNK